MLGSVAKVAIGAVTGAGLALGTVWGGDQQFIEVEQRTEAVIEQANAIINDLNALVDSKDMTISSLQNAHRELQEEVFTLEEKNQLLQGSLDYYKNQQSDKTALEAEVQQANEDAEAHVNNMNAILDNAKFAEVVE